MLAVVLVGGFGTRLRPLTLTTPKPMLPVGHAPMLERVLGNLARGGVTEAVLSLGFQPDAFTSAFPDGTCAGVQLHYAVEPEPLDTAGAIRFAAEAAGARERFLVVNGDVLTDLDVSALVAFHAARDAEATLHLTPVEDPSAFGVVPTDPGGRVLAFIEKPAREEAPTNLINGGTYVFEASMLERIPTGRRVSVERETFPQVVSEGRLFAMATGDYWLDTGRPDQYVRANLDVLEGIRSHDRCEALGRDVTISPRAVVASSVVGDGCVVAAGASLVGSVLLPGVVLGEGACVESSAVGRGAVIGTGARLVGCVVGDAESIPEGVVLEGARVPEPS
jgi:mannose-1-phosphate guanylyltransferase